MSLTLIPMVILGLILVAALAAVVVVLATRRSGDYHGDNPNLIPCPDCGQLISIRARLCPHCGGPIKGV